MTQIRNAAHSSLIRFILALGLALSAVSLNAQIPRSQIRFAFAGVLSVPGQFSTAELNLIETRIAGALSEAGRQENYSIVVVEQQETLLDGYEFGSTIDSILETKADLIPPQSRGLIIGSLNRIGSRFFLDLQVFSLGSGELLLAHSGDFDALEDLVSSTRPMVFSLFGLEGSPASGISQGVERQAGTDLQWQRPSLAFLSGTWLGDTGLGNVVISSDGRGTAELAGNNSMQLRIVIDGDRVRIRQDEPNAPKMYLSLFPYSIATQIVDLARPMSWEFRLASDGNSLIGEKFTSYFYIEDGQISRVDNTYSRAATWIRID